MNIIHRARRAGKTTELVDALRANPTSKLVVFNAEERRRLIDTYKLTTDQAARVLIARFGALRGVDGDVAIDNVDLVLREYLGRGVDTISASTDERP